MDIVGATLGLIVAGPLMLSIGLVIKLTSRGPVLFRQTRTGKDNTRFTMLKFRTMRLVNNLHGPSVTRVDDPRLTSLGRWLRRYKLDELPQLAHVLIGDMSLVGPRPKVPSHQVEVLLYKPGITGASSLAFRWEEHLLANIQPAMLEQYQIEVLSPLKNALDCDYMKHAKWASDCQLLILTLLGREINKAILRTRYDTSYSGPQKLDQTIS